MIEVRPAGDPRERQAALVLRQAVFVDEQGVPPELELDADDADALHIVALREGVVVGTCRVLDTGDGATFGRLAVSRDARGCGIGSALLGEAERRALARGRARMTLAAQASAVGLYERAGYAPVGEPFLDAGIEHRRMEKALA